MDKQRLMLADHDNLLSIKELHWDADADDFVDAFYAVMIGSGFHPEMVLNAMSDFVLMMDEGQDHDPTDGEVRL